MKDTIFQSVRLHEKCIIPSREQILWLMLANDGAGLGPIATCTVHIMQDRSALIQFMQVADVVRKCGVGLAFLEFLHGRYGPLSAIWTSKAGCSLARKFERLHGKQPWQIGCVRLPDEIEAMMGPLESETDIEYAEGQTT